MSVSLFIVILFVIVFLTFINTVLLLFLKPLSITIFHNYTIIYFYLSIITVLNIIPFTTFATVNQTQIFNTVSTNIIFTLNRIIITISVSTLISTRFLILSTNIMFTPERKLSQLTLISTRFLILSVYIIFTLKRIIFTASPSTHHDYLHPETIRINSIFCLFYLCLPTRKTLLGIGEIMFLFLMFILD